jgi:hypothetical protein
MGRERGSARAPLLFFSILEGAAMTLDEAFQRERTVIQNQFRQDPESEIMSQATLFAKQTSDGHRGENGEEVTILLAMPGLTDLQQRQAVRHAARECEASTAIVTHEAWVAAYQLGDAATRKQVEDAHSQGTMKDLPTGIREECLRMYGESKTERTRCFQAPISRNAEGVRTLGDWEELVLGFPRPNFRRYLPEEPTPKKEMARA